MHEIHWDGYYTEGSSLDYSLDSFEKGGGVVMFGVGGVRYWTAAGWLSGGVYQVARYHASEKRRRCRRLRVVLV